MPDAAGNLPIAPRLLIVSLILTMLAAMAVVVSKSDPLLSVHARYWNYAIPAALTDLVHGVRGFVIFDEIARELVTAGEQSGIAAQNALIHKAETVNIPANAVVHLLPGDEKGAVDFVKAAFVLFGMSVESLFYLYATIVFVSVITYVACYFADYDALALLLLLVVTLFLVLMILPVSSELGGILNQRAFGLLSAVSALHVMVGIYRSAIVSRPFLFRILVTSTLQLTIIIFISHIRETETWYVIYLLGAGVATAGIGLVRSRPLSATEKSHGRRIRRLVGPISLFLLTIALFSVLQIYKLQTYNPRYFQTHLAGKIFWHNVGIGLAVNSDFAAAYQLTINDRAMMDAVRRYVEKRDPSQVDRIFGAPSQVITRYAPGYIIDFALYEKYGRALVLRAIADCPMCAFRLVLFDKPKLFIKQTLWAFGLIDFSIDSLMLRDQMGALHENLRPRRAAAFGAFIVFGALIVALGWLRRTHIGLSSQSTSHLLLYVGLMAICSFAPVILTYPLIHLLAVPFLWTVFFLAVLAYWQSSTHFGTKRFER